MIHICIILYLLGLVFAYESNDELRRFDGLETRIVWIATILWPFFAVIALLVHICELGKDS